MDLNNKIRNFIDDNLMIFEEVEYSDSDNIFELGYVNSLFAMKLLNYIEAEFNIMVNNEEMDIKNFSSVLNIVHLVESKIRKS